MSRLLYKTRGMSDPKGKPKVYFACHPDDFHLYFDAISTELLTLQNCAVWYDEDPSAPRGEDEWLSNLSEMQLFVIPITSVFLYRDSRARLAEFPFALKLAYLGGVDVEVDHERAVALIRTAAKTGLMEAAKKLVAMYRNGEGVERNPLTAIAWQEKLVEIRRAAYEKTNDKDDWYHLCEEQYALGEYWEELENIDKARQIFDGILKTAYAQEKDYATDDARLILAITHAKMGDFAAAGKHFEETLKISDRLAVEEGSPESNYNLAAALTDMGCVCMAKGDVNGGEIYHGKSLHILEETAGAIQTPNAKKNLAFAYTNMGDIYIAKGDPDAAAGYHKKSLELWAEISEETSNPAQTEEDLNHLQEEAFKLLAATLSRTYAFLNFWSLSIRRKSSNPSCSTSR